MPYQPDTATVIAARAGDPAAVDRLIAGYLPLVYTIVGRALDGHADVDDVVQETMLRVLRGLGDLREPASFRSWLVAVTVRQVRDRYRARSAAPDALVPEDVRDPGADFTDLAITRLELSGQRRETAEATRWLDDDHRELLALWWLEAAEELTRDEIVGALDISRQHAAVRIQRMKAQLETARVVVRALAADPRCPDLTALTADWNERPGPLWRKRIARHTRDCRRCSPAWSGLVAAELLLAAPALLAPLPALLAGVVAAARPGTYPGGPASTEPAPTDLTSTELGPTELGPTELDSGVRSAGRGAQGALRHAAGHTRQVVSAVATLGVVAVAGVTVALYRSDHAASPPDPAAVAAPVAAVTASPSARSRSAGPPPAASPAVLAPAATRPAPTPPSAAPKRPRPPVPGGDSVKKGVSTWKFPGLTAAIDDVRAGWYYNWSPGNADMPAPSGVEFVPMIWGAANVTDATLKQVRREGRVLLGFNEPDLREQANMTVEKALELWPRLERTGMRLGSPAVAYGADTPGGWLDRFMTGAKSRGLTVDFIALHWYGSDFGPDAVGHLRGYLQAVHRRYGKPIWLTEYGLINFAGAPKYPTDAQQAAFIARSTSMMERLPYVQRYAWFSLPAVGDSVELGLYRDGARRTAAGAAYRAAGG
jgi:RNA polymerase sigma factor (sigma-70 family)